MIQPLPTWKSQHAANTLSHNDVVRLLGDANEEIERLQNERDALRAAVREVLECKVCHGSGVYETKYPPNNKNWDFRRGAWTYIPCECRVNARRVLGEVKG